MTSIGDRVRRLRKEKGWTQARLAEVAGISKGFLHDIENDRRGMGSATLWAMSKALGTSMEYLYMGTVLDSREKTIEKLKAQVAEKERQRLEYVRLWSKSEEDNDELRIECGALQAQVAELQSYKDANEEMISWCSRIVEPKGQVATIESVVAKNKDDGES